MAMAAEGLERGERGREEVEREVEGEEDRRKMELSALCCCWPFNLWTDGRIAMSVFLSSAQATPC